MEVSIPGLTIPLYRMGEYNIYSGSRLKVFPHFPQGKLREWGRREISPRGRSETRVTCLVGLRIFTRARLFCLSYNRWGKQRNTRSLFNGFKYPYHLHSPRLLGQDWFTSFFPGLAVPPLLPVLRVRFPEQRLVIEPILDDPLKGLWSLISYHHYQLLALIDEIVLQRSTRLAFATELIFIPK